MSCGDEILQGPWVSGLLSAGLRPQGAQMTSAASGLQALVVRREASALGVNGRDLDRSTFLIYQTREASLARQV